MGVLWYPNTWLMKRRWCPLPQGPLCLILISFLSAQAVASNSHGLPYVRESLAQTGSYTLWHTCWHSQTGFWFFTTHAAPKLQSTFRQGLGAWRSVREKRKTWVSLEMCYKKACAESTITSAPWAASRASGEKYCMPVILCPLQEGRERQACWACVPASTAVLNEQAILARMKARIYRYTHRQRNLWTLTESDFWQFFSFACINKAHSVLYGIGWRIVMKMIFCNKSCECYNDSVFSGHLAACPSRNVQSRNYITGQIQWLVLVTRVCNAAKSPV